MARLIGFLAVVAVIGTLVVLVLGVLVVLNVISGILWVAIFAPLLALAAGFLGGLVVGASNVLTSDNVKALALLGWGAVGGITFVKIGDGLKAINDFFKDPQRDPLVFVAATAAYFLLVGAAAGLYVGLKVKAPVQTLVSQGNRRLAALFAAYRSLLFPT
jgi:hypothetical protein